jgi:protein-L-isoaspartate(D-aspartate) O-methyltransferase
MRRGAAIVWWLAASSFAGDPEFAGMREHMVQSQIEDRGVTNAAVLAALRKVPRHEFVPEVERLQAYSDRPLPIGFGQTISQPYIVALMTELAEVRRGERVLEVGTGSGYQAAILAEVGGEVYTIEIIEPLARAAAERLKRLGYDKVQVKGGDGYQGWKEHAPFDVILVTAAAELVPPPLVEQLKPGGRLVMPLGQAGETQTLVVIEKDTSGETQMRRVARVVFVPLTREKAR